MRGYDRKTDTIGGEVPERPAPPAMDRAERLFARTRHRAGAADG